MIHKDLGVACDVAVKTVLERGLRISVGHWQGVPTEGKPDLVSREVLGYSLSGLVPATKEELAIFVRPNLPWAEDHFGERVGRVPTNPGVQYKNWPWWRDQDASTTVDGKFTHTYQERFWPRSAGGGSIYEENHGIRYRLGNLDDVLKLLTDYPFTRQAYLPIFFPEDTGAHHGGRIPCSLGYHFVRRGDHLHCWYFIRSCDVVRHLRDDVYMAARLVQWIVESLRENEAWRDVIPGILTMHVVSLHLHEGDIRHVKRREER